MCLRESPIGSKISSNQLRQFSRLESALIEVAPICENIFRMKSLETEVVSRDLL